jgi:hypothetical protein
VPAVDQLEKGDLRVPRQIHVLSTIGDELHKGTTNHFLYLDKTKKFWAKTPKRSLLKQVSYLNPLRLTRERQ